MLKLLSMVIIAMGMLAGTVSATEIGSFINKRDCDQVIDKGYYKVCYDYSLKAARYVGYTLDGSLVNAVNLKKRPRFYEEKRIPKRYRAKHSDYTRTGWDRGHLLSDGSADWSISSQKSTYSLGNIVAMAPVVNRKTWIKAEKYERKVAVKLGSVQVLNGVIYPRNPQRIGRNGIAVPSAYWKMIFNNQGFERCFYYKNDKRAKAKGDKLRNHLVDCSRLL